MYTLQVRFHVYPPRIRLVRAREPGGTQRPRVKSIRDYSRWAIIAEWHARRIELPPPPPLTVLNCSFPSPRVISADGCRRDCRILDNAIQQWRTRYNCVWRIPAGRALTKSINLECSAVFLLENRSRAQFPYAINGPPVPVPQRVHRNRRRKKEGHVSSVLSDLPDPRAMALCARRRGRSTKRFGATNIREGGLPMAAARRKWQRTGRVRRRNRLENLKRN